MKKIFLILLCLFCLLISCSENKPTQSIETATLSGYVFQETNGFFNYISDAKIQIGNKETYTDSTGRYLIELPLGDYSIIVTHTLFDTLFVDKVTLKYDKGFALKLTGGTFSISGNVSDTSGVSISGVIVKLSHLKDTTDVDGFYQFTDIPIGKWNLSSELYDYFEISDSIEVINTNIEKDLNLIRKEYKVSGTVSHAIDGLLSGIEVILDDTLFDTTDINGYYEFENIYSGEHVINFQSTLYDDIVDTLIISTSDIARNFELIKTIFYTQVIDTVWVENDASVKLHEYIDYSVHSETNYGNDSSLELYSDYLDYFSMVDGYVYRKEVTRIFIGFPSSINYQADSVFLILHFDRYLPYYDQFDITFSGGLSFWDESLVNWVNQPTVDSTLFILEQDFQSTNIIQVDITMFAPYISNNNGIRLSIWNEFCNVCWRGIRLFSSEYPSIEKRPYIVLYRTVPLP